MLLQTVRNVVLTANLSEVRLYKHWKHITEIPCVCFETGENLFCLLNSRPPQGSRDVTKHGSPQVFPILLKGMLLVK